MTVAVNAVVKWQIAQETEKATGKEAVRQVQASTMRLVGWCVTTANIVVAVSFKLFL